MQVAESVKYGFNNTSFTARNKALNIALSVYSFINFHKIRCPDVYYYQNVFNFDVCKGVKSFGTQLRKYTVYCKTAMKANRPDKSNRFPLMHLCKTPDRAAWVKYLTKKVFLQPLTNFFSLQMMIRAHWAKKI